MPQKIDERFFSFSRYLFFEVISIKFRPGSVKKLIDFSYVIFEKIATKFDIISSNYFKMYRELVDKEIKMIGLSPKDQILVIGCGSLPITAVLIAKKTKAHVLAIDKDDVAVKKAVEYIKNHHLEDRIVIEHANGEFYPLNRFNVIFLAYNINYKVDFFKAIADNIKKDSRIIFRTVIGSEEQNKKNTTELSKWFLVKNSIKSKTLPPTGSYFLLKKD